MTIPKDDVSCNIIDDVTTTSALTSLLMSASRQMQTPLTGIMTKT
jgi:hypothetical protein